MRRIPTEVVLFAVLLAACDSHASAPPASAPPPSAAPPSAPPAPATAAAGPVVLGIAMPVGAVVYAQEPRRVFRGVTSDVTWVATQEDALGMLPWMSQHMGTLGDVVLDMHGPHDPGVPQTGLPTGSGAVLALTRVERSERCAPCYDALGARVAEPVEGCDCP